jgi:hypothetical protein
VKLDWSSALFDSEIRLQVNSAKKRLLARR